MSESDRVMFGRVRFLCRRLHRRGVDFGDLMYSLLAFYRRGWRDYEDLSGGTK